MVAVGTLYSLCYRNEKIPNHLLDSKIKVLCLSSMCCFVESVQYNECHCCHLQIEKLRSSVSYLKSHRSSKGQSQGLNPGLTGFFLLCVYSAFYPCKCILFGSISVL